ncbi:hypothetical protein [Corynebacterium auriscanis]|uniref:hypothetical protein n=1 Tax=Corynebacterium auriscanis TaxID=99807 RepID=UPI003CF17009
MSFTLFAGRGHIAREIVEILEDFAALQLVDNFAWVDIDAFENSDSRVFAVQRFRDELRSGYYPLTDVLSRIETRHFNRVIINVHGQEGGGVTAGQLGHFDSVMEAVNHNLHITYANVVVPYDMKSESELPLFRGYINLLISPEDSDYPGKAAAPIGGNGKRGEISTISATTLSSLCGLWEGAVECPLMKLDSGASDKFRLVRAYYHRVDGQQAQSVIKSAVFDTTENPIPTVYLNSGGRAQVDYTDNPVRFAEESAAELFDNHATVFEPQRTSTSERRGENISAAEARKRILSGWGKSLVNGPKDFFLDVRAAFQEFSDDQLQKLYGHDSRMVVGRLQEYGQGGGRYYPPLPEPDQIARDLSGFWHAYENTALTLLDARPRMISGSRGEATMPKTVWNNDRNAYFVARSARDVIPGPSSRFGGGLSVELQAIMGDQKVSPYDIRGVHEYEQRLHHSGRSTGRIMGEFGRWKQNHSNSFAFFVGSRIQSEIARMHQKKQQILEQLEREKTRTIKQIQGTPGLFSRVAGWVTVLTFIMFFGAKLIVERKVEQPDRVGLWHFVDAWNSMDSEKKTWILLGWLALWLVLYLTQKFSEARAQLAVEGSRNQIIDRIQALEDDLYQCDASLRRLEVAYGQFVCVSDFCGALLEKPFGGVSTHVDESAVPSNKVTRSVNFRELDPGDPRVERIIKERRTNLFNQGWLDTYVQRGQNVAIEALAREHNRAIRLDGLFAVQGGPQMQNKLTTLAQYVQSEEFNAIDRSREDWARITTELRDHSTELLDSEFTADPVQQDEQSLGGLVNEGRFVGSIASAEGRTSRLLDLDPSLSSYERLSSEVDAVGSSELLVQVGHQASESELQRGTADNGHSVKFVAGESALPGEDVVQPDEHRFSNNAGEPGPVNSNKPTGFAMPGEDVF